MSGKKEATVFLGITLPNLGRIHIDTSAGYRLLVQVKLVRVERSRSLVQAQTLVIQTPLKIWSSCEIP